LAFKQKLLGKLSLKIISLLLAVFLWFFVIGRRSSEIGLEVPVRFENLPESLVIVNNPATHLEVRVQGPRTFLSSLDPTRVNLSLDLSAAKAGRSSYHIFPEQIVLSRGLRVSRINPSEVSFEFSPVVTRELLVRTKTEGDCARGYKISQINVSPARVGLTGAAQELNRIDSVETEPVSLKDRNESFRVVVPLMIGGVHITRAEPKKVEVQVEIVKTLDKRWFKAVPIKVVGLLQAKYQIRPAGIDLFVLGPELILSELKPEEIKVYLEGSGLSPGKYRRRAIIELPDEITLLDTRPPWFNLEVYR
jgi:YbbR domain-containing protein